MSRRRRFLELLGRAKASHTLEKYTHKPAIPMQVFDAVQEIYEDLMREDLLSRCHGGFT